MITSTFKIIFLKKSAVKYLSGNFLLGVPGRNNKPNTEAATLVDNS
ncbi:MAG: hypothetical protein ACTMUP_03295 [cyanobacterium endosymbiont of Rhopalodia musculus]